ncbi:alkaline phosphatase [Bacillus sp. AK128]
MILFKSILVTIFVFASFAGICLTPERTSAESKQHVKNVILLIGDGMGLPYTSAYRYLKDNPNKDEIDLTTFDQYLVGYQMTYPNDKDENITNSAAAGTALATGFKTYNNGIAMNKNGKKLKSVLEMAKENGKATGLVATAQITHATPAAFGAHNIHRKNMNDIANDYVDELISGNHKIDVLLGGGRKYFDRKDRNLIDEFKNSGFSYVTDKDSLLQDKNEQILGLFSMNGLPKMLDRDETIPSLKEMTNSAIQRLNTNPNGFFLMVEGSQIDWAGHDQDIVSAMSEVEDFDEAFKQALKFAEKDQHTLVIATADHSTGGFTIGANGIYNWFSYPIKAAKRTPDYIAQKIIDGEKVEEALERYIDLNLSTREINKIKSAADTKVLTTIDDAIEDLFNQRTNTGWTTNAHTGDDVPIYAYGPNSEEFHGLINNTDIAKIIFDVLK